MDSGIAGTEALLLYPPGLEFITALFGCFYANVVAIPAFPPRRNRNMGRLRAISQDAKATVALTTDDVSRRLKNLIVGATDLEGIRWIATDKIADACADAWRRPIIQPDELAVLQYTSGSTGRPKGVMLSHSNLLANCRMITEAFEASGDDISMTWLPTYHDMGLIGGVLEPVFVGTPVVMMSPMAFLQQPVRWLRAITKHGITVAGGPNFAYDLCTKKISEADLAELDLSHWTLAFNGAEPVRHETLENFAHKFARCGFRKQAFHPCYGMAECSSDDYWRSAFRIAPDAIVRSGSTRRRHCTIERRRQGQPHARGLRAALEEHTVLIVDPKTEEVLQPGKIGEVWVSGPSVGIGYLEQAGRYPGHVQEHVARISWEGILANGRSRLFPRRPVIRQRSHQGHDHRPWRQQVPAGHRDDGRAVR